jgi:glyoxylase-like metal-dependent hydrolase (beta-lactamase superfamily II)
MEIFPLNEGSFTIDHTKEFIPFDTEVQELNERPSGSLLVEIQPFCIRIHNEIIILDTGLGFNIDGEMQIHRNLKNVGIEPSDVTMVLLSHLHKDHAGGISDSHHNKLTFPNAVYYIHEDEMKYAAEKGKPSYDPADFEFLRSHASCKKLTAVSGSVNDFISFEISGGHCPYHTVFWIKDNEETAFFGGDVAPQLQQMKRKFIAKYDADGRKSMELREQWWQKGQAENWTFLFFHDIHSGVYR